MYTVFEVKLFDRHGNHIASHKVAVKIERGMVVKAVIAAEKFAAKNYRKLALFASEVKRIADVDEVVEFGVPRAL